MTFEEFIETYLAKGLLKRQRSDLRAVEKLVFRAFKDLKAAKANLSIDEGIAYTIAYLAMLHSARAFMLLKGFRPANGYQHKTAVEFMSHILGDEFKTITEHFDKMRRKRNIFIYESDDIISKTEAERALDHAMEFINLLRDIIKKENPQLELKFELDEK